MLLKAKYPALKPNLPNADSLIEGNKILVLDEYIKLQYTVQQIYDLAISALG